MEEAMTAAAPTQPRPLTAVERMRLTEARERSLWGFPQTVKPALVDRVFGDGRQIIGFETLDSRPAYYVVRVDSTWSASNWDDDAPVQAAPDDGGANGSDDDAADLRREPTRVGDHVDEIYLAIEESFGNNRWCDRCGQDEDSCAGHAFKRLRWPALDDRTGGCAWWRIEVLDAPEARA
jgi:hypothetical protein